MLTVEQAAKRLQVTPQRVRNLIYSGALPAEKFGRIWRIPTYAVDLRIAGKPKPGRPPQSERAGETSYHFVSLNHDLYLECQRFIEAHASIDLVLTAESEAEREFFVTLWNFFLQRKQITLIEQGVF